MATKITGTNTAAAPGVTGDDTDTGLFYGTNEIGFSTGGTSRLTLDSSGFLNVPDNGKIRLGTGNDLTLFHNGTNSILTDSSSGFNYKGAQFNILNAGDTEYMARFIQDGAVELYFDNTKRFETKSDGVDIIGELQCDSLDVDGAAEFTGADVTFYGASYNSYWDQSASRFVLEDNTKITFGNGDDLEIFSGGSIAIIKSNNDDLRIQAPRFNVLNTAGTEHIIDASQNGAVHLYYDNNKCLETRPDGGIEATDGNFIVGTSGHGIQFDTGDSGSNQLLNDYEEGTFTPTAGGWSSPGTTTYTAREGYYIKIGQQVTVWLEVTWSDITNGGGVQAIGGFPFAHTGTAYSGVCWTHTENLGDDVISGKFGDGYGSGVLLYKPASGSEGYVAVDSNGGTVRLTCTYLSNT